MSEPHAFPVSIKGVCIRHGRVLLLRNEREEWELPGGRLDLGEDPIACVRREIHEETGWAVTVGAILDAWQYGAGHGADILVITYGCLVVDESPPVVSRAHKEAALFDRDEILTLNLPGGYRRSIDDWFARLDAAGAALGG